MKNHGIYYVVFKNHLSELVHLIGWLIKNNKNKLTIALEIRQNKPYHEIIINKKDIVCKKLIK